MSDLTTQKLLPQPPEKAPWLQAQTSIKTDGGVQPNAQIGDVHSTAAEVQPGDGDRDFSAIRTEAAALNEKSVENATAAVLKKLVIFYDMSGNARLLVSRISGRKDVLIAESSEAADYVREMGRKYFKKPLSANQIEMLISTLRAQAREAGDKRDTPLRITLDGDMVCVDLANTAGDLVHVSASGYSVVSQGSVLFRRGGSTGELPRPTLGLNAHQAYDVLSRVLPTWGVRPDDVAVIAVMLPEWLRPRTPKPICELVGGPGTAKTSTAEALISVVDPAPKGAVPSCPIDEKALMARVQDRMGLLLDNLSKLTNDASDLICRVATGGAISNRKLYAQHDSVEAYLLNPIVCTSIVPVLNRSDARTRTLSFNLRPITGGVRSAEDVRADFTAQHPEVFGAVCALLSAGMARLPVTKTQKNYEHRLVDFEQLGEAIHQTLGQPTGWFVDLMTARRKSDAQDQAESDLVLRTTIDAFKRWAPLASATQKPPSGWQRAPGYCAWLDAAGHAFVMVSLPALLDEIKKKTFPTILREGDYFPNNPQALRGAIIMRQQTFLSLGWQVEITRRRSRSFVCAVRL